MATKKTARRKVSKKKAAPKKVVKKKAKTGNKAKKSPRKQKKASSRPKDALKKKISSASKKAKNKKPRKVRTGKSVAKKGNKPSKTKKTAKSTQATSPKKAPERPLDPVFVKIRENLLASRSELFKMVESSQELERNVSELTFSNEIDLASSLEGREMVFQLASRDRNGLKMIDDALFKMEHGTYGICEGCAKPIGIKRLQIMPLTLFCIECQALMEHVS